VIDEVKLGRLERIARDGEPGPLFDALRQLPLREVGELLRDVPERLAALRAALPSMPSDRVQIDWTGTAGQALLEQGLSFVGAVSAAFEAQAGRPLKGARILDYGCGWGRLIRLMYGISDPDLIYGCDAWESSLDLCRDHRVRAHLARCQEVPTEAPFPAVKFDLIYAFSLLTHLSERTARAVMEVLRRSIDSRGLCVVTIRPPEYWDAHAQGHGSVDVHRMKREHAARGFAFTPHERAPVGDEVTFGDASISLEYVEKAWPGWSVVGSQRGADPLQQLVLLRPA
jgi:SAM-dependent methyltransferase